MHRRENNDKRARSEPEIGGCRYTRLREEVEASLKPAMFHHSVRTPSLLRGVYHGEPQHTVLFISISVEKKTSTDAGLQKCGDGHFHRLILNLRRTNNLAPTSLDIYSLSEHSGVIFTPSLNITSQPLCPTGSLHHLRSYQLHKQQFCPINTDYLTYQYRVLHVQ